MSKGFQQVIVIGNLGGDPEVRITGSGKTVTNFNVAANTGSGEYEHTEWFRCVAWERLGEVVGEYCRKGSRIQVIGELRTESWEDKESGEKKYRTNLRANQVLLLDSKPRDVDGGYEDDDDRPRRSAPAKSSSSSSRSAGGTRPATTTRRPSAPPPDDDGLPF